MTDLHEPRRARYWDNLPPHPAGSAIYCVGNYRPQGHDPHGTYSNHVSGCRCSRCNAAACRYKRSGNENGNRLRARQYLDPAHFFSWRDSAGARKHLGGPWRLFYAVLLPSKEEFAS